MMCGEGLNTHKRPSDRLSKLQFTMLKDVFQAPMEDL